MQTRAIDERVRERVLRYWSGRVDAIARDSGLDLDVKLARIRACKLIRDRVVRI